MKKWFKILGGMIASILLVIFLAGGWYVYKFYPRHATEFEVGDPDYAFRILLATQGSEFKNALVARLISIYADQPVFIRVMDVSGLPEITPDNWHGIAILNTSIADNINSHVKTFLNRVRASDRVILITTSGGGDFTPPDLNVDGITTASRLTETEKLARQISKTMGQPIEATQQE